MFKIRDIRESLKEKHFQQIGMKQLKRTWGMEIRNLGAAGLLTGIWLFVMAVVFPLYTGSGYEELVYKKWQIFFVSSAIYILLMIAAAFIQMIKKHKRNAKKKAAITLSTADFCVIGYLVCVIISYIGAIDRKYALVGMNTWYMGFLSQLIFVGIYFCVSRGFKKIRWILYAAELTFLVASTVTILQRFNVNVFGLYTDLQEVYKKDFVSTIGQVTWTSSYITILLVAGIGILYKTENILNNSEKLLLESAVIIGMSAAAVLNCDSGLLAICSALLILFWDALQSSQKMQAYTRVLTIMLTAVFITGIAERIFAERMVIIDSIYFKAAQSPVLFVLLIGTIFLYYCLKKEKIHMNEAVRNIKNRRIGYILLLLCAVMGIICLFILHTAGYFPNSPVANYFHLTVWWGNSRGFIWKTGAAVFQDFGLGRKLFGCGPDCFSIYSYELMGDEINAFWHNQIVPNAHNEWLNAVINFGLIGGGLYLGIFVLGVKRFLKAGIAHTNPFLLGIGLAAAAYIVHNFLCYQQIIGTTLIFILIGIGESLIRKECCQQ